MISATFLILNRKVKMTFYYKINYVYIAIQNTNVLDSNISMFQEDIDFVTILTL